MIRHGSTIIGIVVMLGGVKAQRPIKIISTPTDAARIRVPHDKLWGDRLRREGQRWGSVGATTTVIGCRGTKTRCGCSIQHPARHQGVLRSWQGV
jgi:hypothetical protein